MEEVSESVNTSLSVGQKLAQARQAQHMTIEQVARYMRLSEGVIKSLESDTAAAEIPSTYIRGYVRAYAKLLDIESEVVAPVATPAPSSKDTGIVGIQNLQKLPQQRAKPSTWSVKSVAVTVLLIVTVAGGFLWWRSGFVMPAFVSPSVSTNDGALAPATLESKATLRGDVPLSLAPEQSEATGDSVATTDVEAAANIEPVKTTETETKSTGDAAKTNTAATPLVIRTTAIDVSRGGETLEFVFVEDCWVRVTDAQGDVLAVGIKRTGQRFVVAGPAPLKIDLGNPTGVQLKHNNRSIDLSIYPGGRPARLTIEATKFE